MYIITNHWIEMSAPFRNNFQAFKLIEKKTVSSRFFEPDKFPTVLDAVCQQWYIVSPGGLKKESITVVMDMDNFE